MSGLQLIAVRVGYGRRAVVADLDLTVEPGEVVAVVGPNGAGKTTLLDAICGLVPTRGGAIIWRGRRLRGGPVRRARLGVGRSFQHDATFADLDVRAHLSLVSARPNSAPIAACFGLPLAARAADLTLPERRRLDLARVLASPAELLLLDEPSAGLGDTDLIALRRCLRERRPRPTVLMAEHSPAWIEALAHRSVTFGAHRAYAPAPPSPRLGDGPEILWYGVPERPLRGGERAQWTTNRPDAAREGLRSAEGRRICILDDGRGLIAGFSIGDQWRLAAPAADPDRWRAVGELLPGVPSNRAQPVATLSGGERTLVALGAAFLAQPDAVVIVDPRRGLAPESIRAMYETFDRLCEEGRAVLTIESPEDGELKSRPIVAVRPMG